MNGAGRFEADQVADLPDCGRVAVGGDVFADCFEDLDSRVVIKNTSWEHVFLEVL